jgi:hypothetical protein
LLPQCPHLGCPLYILDPRGQAGHKIPAWDPQARRAQNMGFSPLHASSVALTWNLNTGHISPQFHVVYDDYFETFHTNGVGPPDNWSDLIIMQSFQTKSLDDDDPDNLPELGDEWLNLSELADHHCRLLERKNATAEFKSRDGHKTDAAPREDPPHVASLKTLRQRFHPLFQRKMSPCSML